jgi:3-methyladenine DNA glycosylase AlkD
MSFRVIMAGLRTMGTEQNRNVYARHGVGKKMYGVSYANLNKLKKKIDVDQALAEQLWASGNHDARVLATMVSDPVKTKSGVLDAWVKDVDSYVLGDALRDLVAETPFALKKFEQWSRSKSEFVGQVGWGLLSFFASHSEDLNNAFFIEQLRTIDAEVHARPNRIRHSMNEAIITIGARNATLRKRATAAANRIGTIVVDHGDTSCTTPAAVPHIDKMWKRKEAKGK